MGFGTAYFNLGGGMKSTQNFGQTKSALLISGARAKRTRGPRKQEITKQKKQYNNLVEQWTRIRILYKSKHEMLVKIYVSKE